MIGGSCVAGPLACSLVAAPALAAPAAPAVVEPGRPALLSDLAPAGMSMAGIARVEERSTRFSFPPRAKQGPDTWYMIRLGVRLAFAPDSGPGSVLVSGFTRGQAGAQIEFYSEEDRQGRPRVAWGAVDLIRGSWSGAAPGREARLRYANYLPYAGVRPGEAVLALQVERFGQAKLSEVSFTPDSGIYATEVGPVELGLTASFERDELQVGEAAELSVEIANASSRPAREVVVEVRPQTGHAFIKGSPRRRIARLDEEATVSFRVGRARPGKLRLQVLAAASNQAEALGAVQADVGASGERGGWAAYLLAAAGVLGAGALVIRARGGRGSR